MNWSGNRLLRPEGFGVLSAEYTKDTHVCEHPSQAEYVYAAKTGELEVVRRCLDAGVDVDALMPCVQGDPKRCNYTAIAEAAKAGHLEVVKLILDRGGSPDATEGWPAVALACRRPYLNVIKELIDRGCDVNKTQQIGETPLMHACTFGFVEAAKLLLDAGADIDVTANQVGKTALSQALEFEWRQGERSPIVDFILAGGARNCGWYERLVEAVRPDLFADGLVIRRMS